ncbi:MAG: extracellular solute-binding protein, partial [Patescibacteria group bacterium]|nr:extracellular solute-binding protein [Patescibacteria group bacterium]
FNAAGVSTYPRYWDEFANLNSKLTVRDQNSNIRASAVAMGTLANITNGRELLGSLILQTGNPVTMPDSTGAVVSALSSARGTPTQALDFYSQFADPTSNNYSWNRALPADKVAFLSGTLATYFGFASELADIRAKNPNLNFDVAPLPQVRSGGTASSYARMYGFSVVRASANQNAAYQAIAVMSSAAYLPSLAQVMYLPTVMNALDQNSADPYIENFDKAALISRGWLDADPTESRQVFGDMVDAVVSGQKTADQAIRDGSDAYDVILRQAVQ